MSTSNGAKVPLVHWYLYHSHAVLGTVHATALDRCQLGHGIMVDSRTSCLDAMLVSAKMSYNYSMKGKPLRPLGPVQPGPVSDSAPRFPPLKSSNSDPGEMGIHGSAMAVPPQRQSSPERAVPQKERPSPKASQRPVTLPRSNSHSSRASVTGNGGNSAKENKEHKEALVSGMYNVTCNSSAFFSWHSVSPCQFGMYKYDKCSSLDFTMGLEGNQISRPVFLLIYIYIYIYIYKTGRIMDYILCFVICINNTFIDIDVLRKILVS